MMLLSLVTLQVSIKTALRIIELISDKFYIDNFYPIYNIICTHLGPFKRKDKKVS